MKKRDVERHHEFEEKIAKQCGIFELGGLLLNDNWNPTVAVEAFELTSEEKECSISALLESNGFTKTIYMDSVFAQKLGIPLFIIAHVQGRPRIHLYEVQTGDRDNELLCVDHNVLTEQEFIQWWQAKKGTVQTKPYRDDFQNRAQTSYFDFLLESHGLKWGGNIDGYILKDCGGVYSIGAIIENRFTTKTALSNYDPNKFYVGYNGGDRNTWLPLMKLKDRLNIPLFLMTYSNRSEEQNQVGITKILGQSEDGLVYMKNQSDETVRPCDNILRDLSEIENWISQNMN